MTQAAESPEGYVDAIETAHGVEAYRAKTALAADVVVHFGGEKILEGEMVFDTPVGKSRMDLADGSVVVFDGKQAWVTPADAPILPMARFHALTWPYFLAAPFKLGDPGTSLALHDPAPLNGTTYDTARLTFAAGTGDAPDDWYHLYRDAKTHQLKAMAYIVTYSKDKEEAEQAPKVIVYDDFVTVDGVTLPTTGTFYKWTLEGGAQGKPVGKATFKNIRFVEPAADAFVKPEGAAESKLPE